MTDQPEVALDERLVTAIADRVITQLQDRFVTKTDFAAAIQQVEQHANVSAAQIADERIKLFQAHFDGQFTGLKTSIDQMRENFAQWRESIDSRITARDDEIKRLDRKTVENYTAIEGIRGFAAVNDTKIKMLSADLYGDPDVPSGPPTVFGLLTTVNLKLDQITATNAAANEALQKRIADVAAKADASGKWIALFESRRQRRQKLLLDVWKWLDRSKWFQLLLAVLLGTIALALFPQFGEAIRTVFFP